MKNIAKIKITLTLLVITYSYSCKAQLQQTPMPEQLIIGTWVHENEPGNKWQFTTNGICYWKNENNIIQDTFTYSISYTSPQCGYEVRTSGNQFYYLKLVDQAQDQYCYEIGVDNESLSINYLGTSGFNLFIKEQ